MLSHTLRRGFWLPAILILWLAGHPLFLSAGEPTNVTLLYFRLTAQSNGVLMEWETGTELNTAGFRIERGTNGTFVPLNNIGFILATGSPTIGSRYSATDETAVLGITYTYRLIEIESDSTEIIADEATITYAMTPTPTPILVGGGGGSAPTTAPTVIPPTATPTVRVTANATAVSTATTAPQTTPTTVRSPNTATPTLAATTNSPLIVPTAAPNNQGATTLPVPTSATNNAGGIPIAQAQEPTPAGINTGYPAQIVPTVAAEAYPEATAVFFTPTAYPAANVTNSGGPVTIIGENTASTPYPGSDDNSPAITAETRVNTGRAFLWGGFIVAFLIFIVAVLGAMTLFTRQKS